MQHILFGIIKDAKPFYSRRDYKSSKLQSMMDDQIENIDLNNGIHDWNFFIK